MNTKDLLQKTGMLAVLALALASCSEDELINRKGAASNAISFGIASPTHTTDSLPSRSPQAEEPPLLLLGEGKRDTLYLHTSITDNIATPPDQEPATRGIPVDETNFKEVYGSFGITAYAEGGALFMDEKISHESGGIWSPDETRYWPADEDLTLDFYAQAPYDNDYVKDVSAGEGKISFPYTVPGGTGNTDAEAQPDILFAYAACSKAKSDGGTVSLKFRHALAGVKFVASNVTGSTIKNITLKGLKGEGTCTYDAETGTFDWQTIGGERDFSQTFDVELSGQQAEERQPITDKRPKTTFMMIPQTLEGVTVEVTLEETASGESFTLTGSLAKTGTWEAGKIYTYAISTESINWEYVFEVTPSPSITLPLGTTTGQYTVTSYRQRKGDPSTREAVAWKAENTSSSEKNLENNTSTNVPLNEILSEFTYEDDAPATISTGYDIELTETTLHTTYEGDQTLKDATPKGSPENPYDLSTEGGTISQTTANCYVVNAAGTYQLPLVYGNALKNGSENRVAYQGFKDYQNRTISSSRITGADDAVLVWSDGFFMFKDIHLDATGQNLVFTIDSNYMQQANAVLAVRDASNRIMWSWHIWVTERPVYTERHILQDLFVGSNTYELMQCNLGWVDGKMVYYNQRDLTFRFTQAGSGETAELKVRQEGATFDYKDVGSTYYQWGRKDPLVALKNWKSYRYEDYRLHETGDPDYVYRYETGPTSIGEAIQHPNVFYTRGTTGGADWNNEHIKTLWNAGDNGGTLESTTSVKTIYDPSPRGFKVPMPRAFAIFVGGNTGDGSSSSGKGELNGHIYEDDVHNKYRVYPRANQYKEEEIPLTATGQRADIAGLPVYEEYGSLKSEVGGLWSLYGVYYWTCVPINTTSAYTLVIRKDFPWGSGVEVYSYGFAGTKTMARPVRPIADR